MNNTHSQEATPLKEYIVNEENDKLLFEFAAGRLDQITRRHIKSLIESNSFWQEYYEDMKTLYDSFGEKGWDISSDNELCSETTGTLKIIIADYDNQVYKLVQEYKTKATSKDRLNSIITEIIDIGDALLNIPENEMSRFSSIYCKTLLAVCKGLEEIIDIEREIGDLELQLSESPKDQPKQFIEISLLIRKSCDYFAQIISGHVRYFNSLLYCLVWPNRINSLKDEDDSLLINEPGSDQAEKPKPISDIISIQ